MYLKQTKSGRNSAVTYVDYVYDWTHGIIRWLSIYIFFFQTEKNNNVTSRKIIWI